MRRSRGEVRLAALIAALGAILVVTGCRPAHDPAPAPRVTWSLEPSTPAVGPARLNLVLRQPDGGPIAGARVRVEGHMTHAGMRPVIADAVERSPGVYDAPLSFTMAGDWVLLVMATLPDGRRVEQRIDVPKVRPEG